jgi:hypothetical protein
LLRPLMEACPLCRDESTLDSCELVPLARLNGDGVDGFDCSLSPLDKEPDCADDKETDSAEDEEIETWIGCAFDEEPLDFVVDMDGSWTGCAFDEEPPDFVVDMDGSWTGCAVHKEPDSAANRDW